MKIIQQANSVPVMALASIALASLTMSARAGLVAQYNFESKDTANAWEYADSSGNGHHGNEIGSFYNYDGDPNPNADMHATVGGARGGVYSYRWANEVDYDSNSALTPPPPRGLSGSLGGGSWDNNRVNIDSTTAFPDLAANAGLTIALWVNPQDVFWDGAQRPHWGERSSPNADYSHLVALGSYGNAPIMTLELDVNRRLHGWVEGNGSDSQVEVTGTGTVSANAWTHVAITYDRVNNLATTYINGSFDSSTNISGVGDGILAWSGAQLGGSFTSGTIDTTFIGQMDDIYIYDEVRTEEQIMALVPEPSSALFLGLAGAGLACIHRRRKQ